jgi:type I restriction enzyme S subunit
MNAERLLAHYERIADAPDAIGRLRRFILDLAVRGKIEPQDADDEPASELLKRIAKEKSRLEKTGGIRSQKPLPAASEAPFPIPANWCWSQIAEIGVLNPRNEVANDVNASFIPMPMIAAEYGVANGHEVRRWGEIKKGYTHFAEGDVGLAKITPCFENGKSTVFRNLTGGMGSGTTELHIVRPLFVDQNYVLMFFKSPHFIETGIPKMTGTAGQKRVSAEYFAYSPFPLPPVAEQHRIVAKVNELMALCDRLEAARAEREALRDRLAAASLARLNTPDPESFHDDARFALNALPSLTTRPDQIKQLRQTILNLALRGKVVPQDPADEPASKLLKQIDVVRCQMLRVGYPNAEEARSQAKKLSQQIVPDGLEDIPIGWAWATLQQCSVIIVDCKNKTAPYSSEGIRLIRTTNVRDGRMNLIDQRYVNQKTFESWSARCIPEPGDILITREAPMGEVCLIPPGVQVCLGQRMMLVRLVPETIDRDFMIYSLRDPNLLGRVQDKPIGATVQHLRVGGVETLLVPLPPLAEQRRIVAKLDEMMAICDRLEFSLTATEVTRRRLLDGLLHVALSGNAEAPRESPTGKLPARSAVSAYVVSRLAAKPSFGRTAHMKHLYLAEAHLGLALDGKYTRQAAGPWDPGIHELERRAQASGCYSVRASTLASGLEKIVYEPGSGMSAASTAGVDILGDAHAELDRLFQLLGDKKTEDVEIVATLFAAWNDALIDGLSPDDDWVINEVRQNWHASKQRFGTALLKKWLGWMRDSSLVPTGKRPRTIQQATLKI